MYAKTYDKFPAEEVMAGLDEWAVKHGLKQIDIANMSGIATNSLSRWRSGIAPFMTYTTISALISGTGIPFYELIKYVSACDIALKGVPKELILVFNDPLMRADIARMASSFAEREGRNYEIADLIEGMEITVDYSVGRKGKVKPQKNNKKKY